MPEGCAGDFVSAARATKLTHIAFVRHANSLPMREGANKRADQPHGWKLDDQMRCLTTKGEEQCEEASAAWFGGLPLRAILASPARRATETAMRMAAAYETAEAKREALYLRMVESSHPAGMSETCESLFETRGYGPLRGFFEAENGEQAFMEYADKVCEEMSRVLAGPAFAETATDADGTCVALFGHAVFLNAIAYKVAQASGSSDEMKSFLLDMDLGETQGIWINLETGDCEHKKVVPKEQAVAEAPAG